MGPDTDRRAASGLDVAKLRALLPHVGTVGLATAGAATPPLRGKVLRLKIGFNPNSSSVGTTVVVFLWSLVASGAVLALTAAILTHRFQRKRKTLEHLPTPTNGNPAVEKGS